MAKKKEKKPLKRVALKRVVRKKAFPEKSRKRARVKIGKGLTLKRGQEEKLSKRPGSSNIGKYKNVSKGDFAGPSGGAAPGTYPINTRKRAIAALAYARNAPNPAGIRKRVHEKYPSLDKKKNDSRRKK